MLEKTSGTTSRKRKKVPSGPLFNHSTREPAGILIECRTLKSNYVFPFTLDVVACETQDGVYLWPRGPLQPKQFKHPVAIIESVNQQGKSYLRVRKEHSQATLYYTSYEASLRAGDQLVINGGVS